MSEHNFAVWKNVGIAFGGIGQTAENIEWRPVVAFLLILGMTESSAFISSLVHGNDRFSAVFSNTAQFHGILLSLIWFVALGPFGVSIHRQVLLFERPTSGYFRTIIETRSLRFAVTGFVFYFISTLVPGLLISTGMGLGAFVFVPLGLVWLLIASVPLSRLCVLLPAIAVDAQNQNLRAAWDVTRGNTWRIWFGLVVIVLPFTILNTVIGRMSPSFSADFVTLLFYDCFTASVLCVQALVSIRFVSLLYRDRVSDWSP